MKEGRPDDPYAGLRVQEGDHGRASHTARVTMKQALTPLLAAAAIVSGLAQENRFELDASERTGTIRRIFVLCHSHLDIGFTRPPDEVARDYKDNIDEAIRLTRANPDFKWTIEEAWMLEEWLRRTDDPALVEELGQMLRSGRMGFGVGFASMHSGLMASEESNRLIYLGHRFRRKFGLKSDVALQNDVPGFTWAYPRVLAQSGVKRLVTGLNLFIGGGNNLGVSKNPFYWVGPDGSRVLTYFTYDSYVEGYRWKLGGRFLVEELERSVPRRLAWLEKHGYKYDTYLLMASPGDNSPPASAYRTLERMREWNAKHPELPMQMATADEFFAYLVEKYGDNFPSASGDSAGHWETVKLRVPEAASKIRQASNTLPAAETAATIASLLTAAIPYPRFDLNEAWYSLLSFHEHTADSGGGWPGYFSRADSDWSNTYYYADALRCFSGTEQALRRSILRVALPGAEHVLVNPVAGERPSATAVVYNGLSWRRSGPVAIERLPAPLRQGPLSVTDLASGEKVSYEAVPGTERQILIFARDVPATGYRTYRIEKASSEPEFAQRPDFPLKVTWNQAGWIASIGEASGSRSLAGENDQPLGRILVERNRGQLVPDETGPAVVTAAEGPLTRRIELRREGSTLPLTTVTLYRDVPYADLRFDVDLDHVRDTTRGDARYGIALPFRATETYIDGAGFVMRVPEKILPGGAPPQFTPVHFVHYAQPGWGATVATLDAAILRPDRTFLVAAESRAAQTREEGLQRLFRTEPRSTPVQSFRFRVGIQGAEMAEWKRFGAEANLPLRAVVAEGVPAMPQRGFLEVDHGGVQVLAFKPAEFQPGRHVIRLQEIGGKGAEGVRVSSPLKLAAAEAANLVEEGTGRPSDLQNLSFKPWETKTILVNVER
jgi:hypothetical protein